MKAVPTNKNELAWLAGVGTVEGRVPTFRRHWGQCMIQELDSVLLACDLTTHGLKKGDIGTVVLVGDAGSYEVEFIAPDGETKLVALSRKEIRSLDHAGSLQIRHAAS